MRSPSPPFNLHRSRRLDALDGAADELSRAMTCLRTAGRLLPDELPLGSGYGSILASAAVIAEERRRELEDIGL